MKANFSIVIHAVILDSLVLHIKMSHHQRDFSVVKINKDFLHNFLNKRALNLKIQFITAKAFGKWKKTA